MGSTTHALLAWGFELDRHEDVPEWLESRDDKSDAMEERYLQATGFLDEHPEPDFVAFRESWSEWSKLKQDAMDDCPCIIRDWGEEAGPAVVFLKGSQCDASGEGATGLDLPHIANLSKKHELSWPSVLMLYCQMMEIPYHEPGWFMTAFWF
jgi:hypothetical protein